MNGLTALLLSIVFVTGFSLISIYIGRVTQKHGAFWASFWIQLIGLPATLLYLPFFDLKLAASPTLIPLVIFGIGITFAYIIYCKALGIGPASIVQAILQLGSVVTFVLAIVLLKESLTPLKLLGASFIIFGAILASINLKDFLQRKINVYTKAIPLALGQAVLSGVLFYILSIGTKELNGFSSSVGTRLFTIPTYLLLILFQKNKTLAPIKLSWKLFVFIAVIDASSYLLFNTVVEKYQVSFASMMLGTIPAGTAVIAALFFKEKLLNSQKIGILLVVLGAVNLAIC